MDTETMKLLAVVLALALLIECIYLFGGGSDAAQIALPQIEFNQIDAGNRQKLQLMYQDAVNQYTGNGSLKRLVRVADILICYGYHLEAAQLYRNIILQDSSLARPWHGLALAFDSLGQAADAQRCYQKLASFDFDVETQAQFRHRIAELYLIQSAVERAKNMFEQNKAHPPSRYRLIRLQLYAGEWEQALDNFLWLKDNVEGSQAIECEQLNDLSLRLFDKELAVLPPYKRTLYLSYQPIDIFKRQIESYYGMSMMELYTPVLREMPQMVEETRGTGQLDYWKMLGNPEVVEHGREVFTTHNCSICHGPEAYGQTGPNLRDDYWLSLSSPAGIFDTISYGRRNSTMPGHQFSLRPDQIRDVTVYLMHINLTTEKIDGKTVQGKEPQGKLLPLERYRP